MPRPRIRRRISSNFGERYFKPQGIPLRQLLEVVIEKDELEALKLYEIDMLQQKEAAAKMGISQPTFARILDSVHKKIADAIIHRKAIRV